jgi:hypothetical protein
VFSYAICILTQVQNGKLRQGVLDGNGGIVGTAHDTKSHLPDEFAQVALKRRMHCLDHRRGAFSEHENQY